MFSLPSRSRSDSHSQLSPVPTTEYYNTTFVNGSAGNTYHSNEYYTHRHPESSSGSYPLHHPSIVRQHREPLSSLSQSYHQQKSNISREIHPRTADHSQPRHPESLSVIDPFNLDTGYSSVPHDNGAISTHSGDIDSWASSTAEPSLPSSRPRRIRREKPRIELAPDQPPTTQGKPRARVYVACLQCRTRKIRCDGAKPACHNCSRRATGNNDCNYDPLPKRRGPDKTPGARQRLTRDLGNNIDGAGPVRRRRPRITTNLPGTGNGRDISPVHGRYRSRSDSSSVPEGPLTHLSPSISNIIHSPDEFISPPFIHAVEEPFQGHPSDIFPQETVPETIRLKRLHTLDYTDPFDVSSVIPIVGIARSKELGRAYITSVDEDSQENDILDISSTPSLTFTRKIWWDSLLSLYFSPSSNHQQVLTPSQRESAAQGITSDIRFLFRASNYWFSFFHIPTFFNNYHDPIKRERIQPGLILALLAMATFWQSSEVGLSRHGRDRALRFRDEAQSALDASFNSGWIDESLAQAAWLLALFEVCAHPHHSTGRVTSSLVVLDSIIRSLSLTFVDADDPNASVFSPGAVPAVSKRHRSSPWHLDQGSSGLPTSNSKSASSFFDTNSNTSGCSCKSMTLSECWPEGGEHAPLWASTPAWSAAWSPGEVRKESCRRLCWSSMILAAGHASYTTAYRSPDTLDLFIADPANYALLFSGESITSSSSSPKDTIWALHERSFLLWHGCMRMRRDERATDSDKAQFAVKTWLEADALEAALNQHSCGIERAFIFQGREYIFNTRMCISYEFQRYIPLVTANVSGLFHRHKAEEWRKKKQVVGMSMLFSSSSLLVTHQATVAERFMLGLHMITGNSGNLLARRPFFVFWFMGQISRALQLWEYDHSLTVAIDVSNALLPALDYLTALWPCPEQRHRYESLRERLANACYVAGVNPPPPPNLTLPPSSSPSLLV